MHQAYDELVGKIFKLFAEFKEFRNLLPSHILEGFQVVRYYVSNCEKQ